jgi:hypothetical protein
MISYPSLIPTNSLIYNKKITKSWRQKTRKKTLKKYKNLKFLFTSNLSIFPQDYLSVMKDITHKELIIKFIQLQKIRKQRKLELHKVCLRYKIPCDIIIYKIMIYL